MNLLLTLTVAFPVLIAATARAFDTEEEDFVGLRAIKDVYQRTKTVGLAWYVYREDGGCRLAKPITACMDREFDLKPPGGNQSGHPRYNWQKAADYGLVRPAGGKARLRDTRSGWSSMTFVYAGGDGKELRVTASRLSPAVLVETEGSSVEIFGGAGLKFFAAGGGRAVPASDLGRLSKRELAPGWLLAWHGKDGPFGAYGWHPKVKARWDFPVLVVFSETLLEVDPSGDGGAVLSFAPGGAALAVMPLFGDAPVLAAPAERHSGTFRREFRAVDVPPTSEWTESIPEKALERCRFWAERLGQFPVSVKEESSHDAARDALTINTSFTFKTVRRGGKRFAPVSPILATARWGGLPVDFSKEPVDSGLIITYGPYVGIEGANSYSYTLKGLGRYVGQTRRFGPQERAPAALRKRLDAEIDKALAAGIMAPWILSQQVYPGGAVASHNLDSNRLIHGYPGENLYFIAQLMEIADAGRREKLKSLMREWEKKYPCLQVTHQPVTEDARREGYAVPLSVMEKWPDKRRNFHYIHRLITAEALYCLDAYARAAGVRPDAGAVELLDPYLSRIDWATGGSFRWEKHARKSGPSGFTFADKEYGWSGCADANRLFAGLVGALRLCLRAGDAEAEDRLRYFFAKTAVLRLAMEKYRYFLYERKLLAPPPDPQELKYGYGHYGNTGRGIHTFRRQGPDDDPLVVYACDEFGMRVGETAHQVGGERLPAYLGMVPELGRFLSDHAAKEVAAYCRKTEESTPDWHIVRGENNWIGEQDNLYPAAIHQLFLARAWVMRQEPETLERYADLSWLARGDWYYLHKLAETIKAYRGVRWE